MGRLPSQVLSARYMTRFRCLAGDCAATCCGGGSVPVEPSTHRRLTVLAEGDAAAQKLLADGIDVSPPAAGLTEPGLRSARLRFLPSGGCSMLDGAGLCRIQSRFGHGALFDVCATYPRYVNEIDGELELFGTLSCPEVSRLALLAGDGFEQERVDLEEAPRKLRNRFTTEDPYFQPYRLVRAASIRLLTETAYGLTEKLFVFLWLADQLRPILHVGCAPVSTADLQAVLGALAGPGVLPKLAAAYRELQLDAELPLAVIWHALPPALEVRPGAQTERFDAIVREVWASYGRQPGASGSAVPAAELGELGAHYASTRAAVPGKVQARLDLCLSRYTINHLLTTPYMLEESLFAYAYAVVVRVALLRFLLQTRLSGFEGTPAELDDQIVEVIYSFVRGVDHADLSKQIQNLLQAQGLSGLPHALCFLAV